MLRKMDVKDPATSIKHWVGLYSDQMYSWALYKTSSKEVSEDLVQETFLAAFQSFEKFKGKSQPKTWLFSILNNKINDHYRSSFRKPVIAENGLFERLFDNNNRWTAEERPQQWSEEQTHLLDTKEFSTVLSGCMQKLPINWASAIQLKYLEEKNSEIVCQELGITASNYWQILHRAKLQLRKCLELNWFK